jgi:hypothetical protein
MKMTRREISQPPGLRRSWSAYRPVIERPCPVSYLIGAQQLVDLNQVTRCFLSHRDNGAQKCLEPAGSVGISYSSVISYSSQRS